MQAAPAPVRLVELMASLSLATDIGLGSNLEHGHRSALLAVALAEAAGLGQDEARHAFYLALLRTVGCTGDDDLTLRLFGDDAGTWMSHVGGALPSEVLRLVAMNLGRADPLPRRAAKLFRAFATLPGMRDVTRGHCEVGHMLGARLGLEPEVVRGLEQVFERWDGLGDPKRLKGEAIDRAVRVAQLAADAQALHKIFGGEQALAVVRKRAGHGYDPALVELLRTRGEHLFAALEVPSATDAVVKAEPGPPVMLSGAGLDAALEAMGQFADVRSRFTRGHSPGVAAVATRAGRRAGLTADEVMSLGRAAHLHDLGRAGISIAIWEKPGALSESEWDRVRMHTYFTERILARLQVLGPVSAIASLAHERLDGSGYHRRLPPGAVSTTARLLATADAYHAMTEDRAYRPALAPERAAETLRTEAAAGRFDRDVVEIVLGAIGQPAAQPLCSRPRHATGLTEREVEVIRLLARGLTNKEIASSLDISTKTAGHHVQHIFEKAGVTTRAAATLFAMQNDLLTTGR